MRALYSAGCIIGMLFFSLMLWRAYKARRIAYANVFGRKLYADLRTNPIGFWIAFGFGVFLCISLLALAVEGLDRFVR